jgi:hypothetical protein
MGRTMTKDKLVSSGKERARGGPARSVADIVPGAGRAAFRRFGFIQSSIVSRWREIVGERYAEVSAPESIRFPQGKRADGTLTLTVARAHAPMMQHVEPAIVERVNRFFGYNAVARITMKQGDIVRAMPARDRPELVALPVDLGESLRTVADPELKAVLESLARGVATKAAMPVAGKVK